MATCDKAGALPTYQTVYDQLTDARTTLTVTSCLAADPIAVQTWTTGEVVKLATVEPRVFVLTFSVNF